MQEAEPPFPRRHLTPWAFATAFLAALTTLALIGCPTATPTTTSVPAFPDATGKLSFSFPVDEEITPVDLPYATGGSGKLTYSLHPDAPPGLTLNADTRELSGAPEVEGRYELTYRASDANGRSDELPITIVIDPPNSIRSIVAAVTVGDTAGAVKFAGLPEPGGGPSVEVSGTRVFVAGGTVFLDVAPEPGAAVDKLLVSLGAETLGYYEVDVTGAAAPYRLLGQIRFDVDPAVESVCVAIAAVGAGGAVGPAAECHTVVQGPVEFGDVQITVSWDSVADLDLHVVDATGEEIYYGRRVARSGGVLDFQSHCDPPRPFGNEHVAWSQGTPPRGGYVVRVNHWENCGAAQTNYVVNVYNYGRVSTFSGTFSGAGGHGGFGDGTEVVRFEVSDGPAPRSRSISARYRGSGDQVFALNGAGENLDDTVVTVDLGDASAEVHVIATNTTSSERSPEVRSLSRLEAEAKGLQPSAQDDFEPAPRPALSEPAARLQWITEFNHSVQLSRRASGASAQAQAQAQTAVAEGDRFTFRDLEDQGAVEIPATARRVVTDGPVTAALWVADNDWGPGCSGAGPCVNQQMVDAMADRFLRPGSGNDIYEWVTAIFGAPWGPHPYSDVIPPAAANDINILLYDIDRDGAPAPGECRAVGYFWAVHNFLQDPDFPLSEISSERLIFFMDAPWFAIPQGPTWEVTDRHPSGAMSALAQELQHMIHFYQKPILRRTASEVWLNEMAGELAEDFIADKTMVPGPRGVAYDDPTAGSAGNRRGRLPIYNLFNDVQVTTWAGTISNYAVNYALGAYLARTYGGAELFAEIVQSDRVGVDAINTALHNLGHDVTFGQVLADWAVATLLSDNTAAPAPYRYNPGTWTSSHIDGDEFRLGSINLYHYRWDPPEVVSDCIGPDLAGRSSQEGPYLHSLRTLSDRIQPPHSNTYATLGRRTGTVRFLVSAEPDNRITVVVKE
ncbi:MAG: putative Ig domain-containing protein [Spirochaetaceae bacterium]|nr:putative Ig domain-containing protein [Spirochaetaceae bacterium]